MQKNRNYDYSPKELLAINKLESLNIIKRVKNSDEIVFIDSLTRSQKTCLKSIQIEISKQCNFRCKYCYHSEFRSSYIDFGQFQNIVTQSKNLGVQQIVLTGGEPLLHPNIEDIFKYISDMNISVSLYTNGYLLTDKLIDLLYFCSIDEIQISLDSHKPQIQNYLTGCADAYYKTINNIFKLKAKKIPISLVCVLNRLNYREIIEVKNFFENELQCTYTFDFLVNGMNCSDTIKNLALSPEEYVDSIFKIKDSKNYVREDFVKPICGVGSSNVYVTVEGFLKICPSEEIDYSLGNVFEDSLDDISRRLTDRYSNMICCNNVSCAHHNYCSGGCRNRANFLHSDLHAPDDVFCEILNRIK